MPSREEILRRDYKPEFDILRQNRMVASHYKYGWVADTYGNRLASAMGSLKRRIELYEQTGNTEYLVDIANFAMIEYMCPQHPQAHFAATDSDQSPGLDGIGARQLDDL